jgi:hypothetical protein
MVRFTRTTESLRTEPRFQHPPSEPICSECRPTLAQLHRDRQPDGETFSSVRTNKLFMDHGSQRPHLLTCNHRGIIAPIRRRHAARQKDPMHRAKALVRSDYARHLQPLIISPRPSCGFYPTPFLSLPFFWPCIHSRFERKVLTVHLFTEGQWNLELCRGI